MHLRTSTLRSQPPLVQLGILIASLIPLYLLSYQYRLRYTYGGSQKRHNAYPPSSPDFERKWLETTLIEPRGFPGLQRYCNLTTWRPTLGFHLPDANGGIGNIKGNFLDFFFFAIDAGATTIVLPNMATRDKVSLEDVWAGSQPFEGFFNETWFYETMHEACPQIEIVRERPNMPGYGLIPELFTARSRRTDEHEEDTRENYVQAMEDWVKLKTGKGIDDGPVMLMNGRGLWQYDVYGLPWNVRRELGQVLRFRDDIRAFAAEVVKNMGLEYGLDIDASERVHERAFLGGHLRVESDADWAHFLVENTTDYKTQSDSFIHHALKYKLSTIYVATGSPSDLARFKHKCAENQPPLNVTSKFDLLSAGSAATLRKMTWDQQALVDMEVLQKSSFFMGMARSSFSNQLCMTRNQWVRDMGKAVDPYEVLNTESNSAFDDGYSKITGFDPYNPRVVRGMWP